MKSIALIDYKHPKDGYANRDQTGTFGSAMNAGGLFGSVITRLKKDRLVIPNLPLAYLKAIAGRSDHEATYYSGMPQGEDVIVIASSMHQYHNELELARQIKSRFPQSQVGFINAFASAKPEIFLKDADFVIKGEPEPAFEKFCHGEIDLKGLVDLKVDTDVTTLPFPDWDGLDISKLGYFPALPRKPFLTIQASRGCPFNCPFCPYMVLQKAPFRPRPIESVISEIERNVEKYGVQSMLFRDITFSLHKNRAKELCKKIAERKFDIDFGCETRLDCMDDELVDLMAAAGFKSINVGIESPEDEILIQAGRRPIKRAQMENMVKRLEANGIRTQAFYILGLESDTPESIKKTIAYSRYLNTFTAQFCVMTPFPGTPTFEKLKDRLLTEDYSKYTEYDPVVRLDGVNSDELVRLRDKAFSGYYSRPQWIWKHGLKFSYDLLESAFRSKLPSSAPIGNQSLPTQ